MLEKASLNSLIEYGHEGINLSSVFMKSIIDEINRNTPVGVIAPYGGSVAPDGYLLCDGQEVSREQYKALFNAIGVSYGAGDGTNTFTLPNLNGRTLLGSTSDFPIASMGGEESHILTQDELPAHTHMQEAHVHTISGSLTSAGAHVHSAGINATGAHTHAITGTAATSGAHGHGMVRTNAVGPYDTIPHGSYSADDSDNGLYSSGNHTHTISGTAASSGDHTHTVSIASDGAHNHELSATIDSVTAINATTGLDHAHNNMMPYLAVNFIIRY